MTASPAAARLPELYIGARTVLDSGCPYCIASYSYDLHTVEDSQVGDIVGRVWRDRRECDPRYPKAHGSEWMAELADGTPVTGPWSKHRDVVGADFCSRSWAITQLRAALGVARAVLAAPAPKETSR